MKLADAYDNYCDVQKEQDRPKAAEKAKRAIQCAGDDARLQNAAAGLRKLIGSE